MFYIPNDICTNPAKEKILNEAERAIEENRIVIFLTMKINSIEQLREVISKYCSTTKPEDLKNIERIKKIILHKSN